MTTKFTAQQSGEPDLGETGWLLDPLDNDVPGEKVVPVKRRAMIRIALVASEIGARFQREGLQHDPMTWMLSPRRMFDGELPIVACMSRDGCARAVLVHGLGLGLDVTAETVNALVNDGDDIPEAVAANCANPMGRARNIKKHSVTCGRN